jgi:GTP:adenosylcobinamide-phosphate guanylyltransferase
MDRNTYEDTGLEIEMVESSENSPFIPKEENIYNVNTMNNRKIIKNQNEDLSAEELALLNSSIVDHFIAALDKAKYIAPFTSLLCVLLALYITGINPLGGQKARKNVMSEEEFVSISYQ